MKKILPLALLIVAVVFFSACANEKQGNNNKNTQNKENSSDQALLDLKENEKINTVIDKKILEAEEFYNDCLKVKDDPETKTFLLYLNESEDSEFSSSIRPLWKLSTEKNPGRLVSTAKVYVKDYTINAVEFEGGPPSGDWMEKRFDCFQNENLSVIKREINHSYKNEKNEYETLQTIEKAYFDKDIKPFHVDHESKNLDNPSGMTPGPDLYPLTKIYLTTEDLLKSFNNQKLIEQIKQ